MPNIADTVFNTGPKDDLITVDVYKDKGTSSTAEKKREEAGRANSLNNIGFEKASAEKARNNSIDGKALVNAINAGLVGKNNKELAERVAKAIGLKPSLSQISPEMKLDLIQDLAGRTKILNKEGFGAKVVSAVRGVEKQLDAAKITDATSVAKFLTTLTGDKKIASVFDLETEMAAFNVILRKAIDLGITETIDILMEQARDKKRAKEMLVENLTLLAMMSDLEGVQKVVSYIGRQQAIAREPDLIQIILMFYRFPPQTTKDQYPNQLNRLKNTLVAVDPNWDKYRRGEEMISNLGVFSYASVNAKTLFMLDPPYKTEVMIASSYRNNRLLNIAKRNYPMAAI